MSNDFVDWIRPAYTVLQGETVEKREQAVTKYLRATTPGDLLAAVFCFSPPHGAPPERLIEAIRKEDKTFSTSDAEFELRVLSGAAARLMLEKTKDENATAITAALALVATDFPSRAKSLPYQGHALAARKWLHRLATHTREVAPPVIHELPEEDYSDEQREQQKAGVQPNSATTLYPIIDTLWSATAKLQSALIKHNNETAKLVRSLELQREETDLLWWVMGETSQSLEAHFGSVDLACAAVVAPREIADLSRIRPLHPSTDSFLDRVYRFG